MPQLFYGFDLDHTIGDFAHVDRYLDFFHLYKKTSNELHATLEKAYKYFIELVVKDIRDGKLKIFNPEILEIVSVMVPELESGLITACIYSNNSHLETLQFAKDVLEEYAGTNIFCTIMHWGHPFRTNEIVEGDPGNAKKTYDVLRRGFEEGCGHKPISPEQVIFYDDMNHPDVFNTIGANNYKLVKPYYAKLNPDSIGFAALAALEIFHLDENEEYFKFLGENWYGKPILADFNALTNMTNTLRQDVLGYDRAQYGGKGPAKRFRKRQTGSKRIRIKRQKKSNKK